MVDIAFLLLIFFLVATTIRPTEMDLPMRLPGPGVPIENLGDPVLVAIEADGAVRWGTGVAAMIVAAPEEKGDLKMLREMLNVAVAAWGNTQAGVMLKIDDGADQQRFIEVLDAFAACGIESVGFLD